METMHTQNSHESKSKPLKKIIHKLEDTSGKTICNFILISLYNILISAATVQVVDWRRVFKDSQIDQLHDSPPCPNSRV
jgi:hypothetical protein